VKGGFNKKEMKFNFRKISAIASSAIMLGASVGMAAAANYPAPFVSGGAANVAIVYGTGSGVSALDVVQAGNIQSDLSTRLGTVSDPVTGGSCGDSDCVLIGKSSDNLNLGNTWGVFTGTIDEDDLSTLLADGTYVADDNDEFDYEQKISIGTPTLSHFRDSDYETVAGLSERTPVVGFKFSSNTFVMNYTLDFTTDAESDLVGTDLDDIEGSDIILLGKTYYVSDLVNDSGSGNSFTGKLTLLDSAETGQVGEGETVTVSGKEVSIDYIDSDEVAFIVDGERAPKSGKLTVGGSYKLSDNSYIGARDISKLEVSGETGSASFSIGSGKLELTSGSDIKLNDDTINGVKGWVHKGTNSGAVVKIDKIVLGWTTDEEVFLTPDQELEMPGFGAVKFTMNELTRPVEEKVTIENDGDSSIAMTVPIKDGDVTLNFLFANSTGDFIGIGKAYDQRLETADFDNITFWEKNQSGDDYSEWMVASYNITGEAQSYVLRAQISYDSGSSRNETTIQKMSNGAWVDVCTEKIAGDTCDIGDVSLTIKNVNYTSGGSEHVRLQAGANVNFHTIFTEGGLKINLPFITTNETGQLGALNLTTFTADAGHDDDTFYVFMSSEDKDDNLAAGTTFNVTIDDNSDNNLHVTQFINGGTGGKNGLEKGDSTSVYEAYIVDDVATRILHYTNPDEDYLEVYYPTGDSETYSEVFLTESAAIITGGGSGSSGGKLGEVLVKDSEVASVSSKNLVIVGGSCINSAAATVLGGAYCSEAFTTATTVGSGEFLIKGVSGAYSAGKIALVVAGYEAADTVNAAKYLTSQTVDTSKEYIGTTSTTATMTTTETA